jgi:hypothetical protein
VKQIFMHKNKPLNVLKIHFFKNDLNARLELLSSFRISVRLFADIAQWEDTHYKAEENVEKLVAEDLHKSYSANYWKAIRELFQILDFTGIDDERILSGTKSC